ncbi:MAG: hypothetical protein IPM39_09110 [Chloroflexi bacterium]|nr:hypothetical protein [Chloroflexota bacterium]
MPPEAAGAFVGCWWWLQERNLALLDWLAEWKQGTMDRVLARDDGAASKPRDAV